MKKTKKRQSQKEKKKAAEASCSSAEETLRRQEQFEEAADRRHPEVGRDERDYETEELKRLGYGDQGLEDPYQNPESSLPPETEA